MTFIEQLWSRLTGEDFSREQFVARLRRDGGIDISNLLDSDLTALLDGNFSGDWAEPAFTFSEMLACYSGLDGEWEPRQIVGWAFAAIVLGQAFRRGHGDISMGFNTFLKGFLKIQAMLEVEESVEIFQRHFGAKPDSFPASQ